MKRKNSFWVDLLLLIFLLGAVEYLIESFSAFVSNHKTEIISVGIFIIFSIIVIACLKIYRKKPSKNIDTSELESKKKSLEAFEEVMEIKQPAKEAKIVTEVKKTTSTSKAKEPDNATL